METKHPNKDHLHAFIAKYKRWLMGAAVVLVALALFMQLNQPERSVANFCKVRQQEQEKLASAKGDTYSSAIFPGRNSSNAHDFAVALGQLEKVAPDGVQSDIRTVRLAYEKIDKDPSQLFSAGFGALSAEDNAKTWVAKNCGQ